MPIVTTIVPIFIIVLLGWGVHRRGFLPAGFIEPANRLVYYVAIPAMIFQSIAKSALKEWFHPLVIALPLIALAGAYAIAWTAVRVVHQDRSLSGTFIQSSGHGNLGYIGLAVAYYFLGENGLAQASLIAGFMIIEQNVLSVMTLQYFAPHTDKTTGVRVYVMSIITNPVIISVIAGLLVSLGGVTIPLILKRSLSIISGLALPTALLIIGASLSLERIRQFTITAASAAAIKLLVMPALGWGLYRLFQVVPADMIPGLILLASPTATVSYVMAKEMQGSTDLAAATISASTLLSAGTLMLWLKLVTG
jgi:malate permease and related proteins